MNGYSFEASETGRRCAANRIEWLEERLAEVEKENQRLTKTLEEIANPSDVTRSGLQMASYMRFIAKDTLEKLKEEE